MKRLIIFLIIICGFSTIFSQVRLGYTLKELKTEFSTSNTKYMVIEEIPCLSVMYKNVEILYYLNKEEICYQTSIITNNLTLAKNIINIYNKQYIIKSRTSWIMLDNFKIINIHLYYLADIGYVFTWK